MVVDLEIRECTTLDEMAACVQLQRVVFPLPEAEISPVRHFVVTKNAGGFALGAFDGNRLAGFSLSVPAFLRGERAFYSHMTAILPEYQSHGIGARLKWAQRERAMAAGVNHIKWTFEPVKARNAYFNLEKLGATVCEFRENFYGIDYATAPEFRRGFASDRLFAEWDIASEKVAALAKGDTFSEPHPPVANIEIINDWPGLVAEDPERALDMQNRIREEFLTAFRFGFVCRGFYRDEERPAFLLYRS